MDESKQDIAAIRQAVKDQRQRLIEKKIEEGLAVRDPPIVVGVPDPKRDYAAVYRDVNGIVHYPAEPAVIITGVPRRGRDDDENVEA
jgi:hypothetical protein